MRLPPAGGRVVARRGHVLVVEGKDGTVSLRRESPYGELKWGRLKGGHIWHRWDADCSASETFTEGVFDCRAGCESVQVDDPDGMASAILSDSASDYLRIFERWHGLEAQHDLIEDIVDGSGGRVRRERGGSYIIDGVFKVDARANAWSREERLGRWRPLCIVADGCGAPLIVQHPARGRVALTTATQAVQAKINFLLRPQADTVFLNQLRGAALAQARACMRGGGAAEGR